MRTTELNFDAKLTPRQEQMTSGLVMGMCFKEIAATLVISARTVETTIANAMERTGAKKTTDLVTWWFVTRFSIPTACLPKSLIAMAFLLLICFHEFIPGKTDLRPRRYRNAKDEYECFCDDFDFTVPETAPTLT